MNKKKMKQTFTINTSKSNELKEIFTEHKIAFTITKNKKKDFSKVMSRWNLPPFEDLDLTTENQVFKVEKTHYNNICKILQPEKKSKDKWVHYKKKYVDKIQYEFSIEHKPKYPVYVISLNRFQIDRCFTIKHLENMNVKYRLCVMTREINNYKKTVDDYNFTNCIEIISIDDNFDMGGTPQRMKCWAHSKELGYCKFWLLDDNIDGYYYYNRLQKVKINNGLVFTSLENFIDNIKEPVGLIGHNYLMDNPSTTMRNPFQVNTKVYSSMLINRELLDKYDVKFTLKYNEDVDLCMECLFNNIKTVSVNYFLSNKKATLSVKGGNTDTIYDNGKKFKDKVDCLINKWDSKCINIVKIINKHKDKRPHHSVDYDKFGVNKVITPIKEYKDETTYEKFGISYGIIYNGWDDE